IAVDAGASINFTPMPYHNGITDQTQNASLTTLLVNGAVTYTLGPKMDVRGDLGIGALMFSGLAMGNPFTKNASGTSGPLGMFAVRAAGSFEYAITPNIVGTVTPSLAFSPSKSGLDAGSILQIDIMAGAGYRM